MRKVKLSNGGIPGVFNCRFANPTAVVNPNRKKKKPTSFVPPPPPQSQGTVMSSVAAIGDSKQWLNMGNGSRQLIPFWKKPISSNVVQVDIRKQIYELENKVNLFIPLTYNVRWQNAYIIFQYNHTVLLHFLCNDSQVFRLRTRFLNVLKIYASLLKF